MGRQATMSACGCEAGNIAHPQSLGGATVRIEVHAACRANLWIMGICLMLWWLSRSVVLPLRGCICVFAVGAARCSMVSFLVGLPGYADSLRYAFCPAIEIFGALSSFPEVGGALHPPYPCGYLGLLVVLSHRCVVLASC